jgi:hypothetical protein
VQGRIDGTFGEVEDTPAAALELLDDPVPMRGLRGDDRQKQ